MFVDNLTFDEQPLALTELQAFVNNLVFDEKHDDSISLVNNLAFDKEEHIDFISFPFWFIMTEKSELYISELDLLARQQQATNSRLQQGCMRPQQTTIQYRGWIDEQSLAVAKPAAGTIIDAKRLTHKDDKLRRVTLLVDEADIIFALQIFHSKCKNYFAWGQKLPGAVRPAPLIHLGRQISMLNMVVKPILVPRCDISYLGNQ
ncbi:hypothetical protein E3N88_09848 [Mikania micrantha]|uniref:Uncharacterized protein n=1 Tax=Mikania micrantha TaxID=192012 RepID=A0A5N6PKZ1_9ASTR|nr:hypothetical protein E3N88_09848 [Mikania micrantha]